MSDLCACEFVVQDIDGWTAPHEAIEEFAKLRERCPAISKLFLPSPIWESVRDWSSGPDRIAAHASVLLLAFTRGTLPRVTIPIHRFLLGKNSLLPTISTQYLRDLQEDWMLPEDPVRRNERSREFRGKLAELQFASWLESQGHQVLALEAFRKGPDIETRDQNGNINSFEVKFIGVDNSDFRMILQSLERGPSWDTNSPYTAINYLVFRVYEAAKQLRETKGYRNAAIIIDETTWHRFQLQLDNDWIDWEQAEFVGQDPSWEQFIQNKGIERLASTIRSLDSIEILTQNCAFEFRSRVKRQLN